MTQEAQPWRRAEQAEQTLNQLLITAENADAAVKNHLRMIINRSFQKPAERPIQSFTDLLVKGLGVVVDNMGRRPDNDYAVYQAHQAKVEKRTQLLGRVVPTERGVPLAEFTAKQLFQVIKLILDEKMIM